MEMTYFSFRGKLESLDFGRMSYSVVNLPEDILRKLPSKKTGLRLQGEINEIPFSLAVQHYGPNYQIIISKRLMKEACIELGESVEIDFRIVNKDLVDIPFEVLEALNADPTFRKKWETLTAGKKRSLVHPLTRAKRPETKKKRLTELKSLVKKQNRK